MNRPSDKKCVMIIAGEASGDLHGANLVKVMKERDHSIFFCGIGGQKLKEEGIQIVVDADALSVMGVTDVLLKFPAILNCIFTTKRILKSYKPDLLILIDYPGFNLHMAGYAKKLGIPVLYYISPKLWAWRPSRVRKIEENVDHMALILPFEVEFYKKFKVKTTFVGNPLLDYGPEPSYGVEKRINKDGWIEIGLLPGSREGEITRHLPVMVEAAREIKKHFGKARFLISIAPSVKGELLDFMKSLDPGEDPFEFVTGNVAQIFKRAKVIVAASGTVTLEAAIAGIPMVIIYKMSAVSFMLAKSFVKVKNVGLASLIAGEEVSPELLQDDATPLQISQKVCDMLENDDVYNRIRRKLLGIRELLGGPGAASRTADIALNMLGSLNS